MHSQLTNLSYSNYWHWTMWLCVVSLFAFPVDNPVCMRRKSRISNLYQEKRFSRRQFCREISKQEVDKLTFVFNRICKPDKLFLLVLIMHMFWNIASAFEHLHQKNIDVVLYCAEFCASFCFMLLKIYRNICCKSRLFWMLWCHVISLTQYSLQIQLRGWPNKDIEEL